MKTYYFNFEGCQLEVPAVHQKGKIDVNASQQSFLLSHLGDVGYELSLLKHLMQDIKKVDSYLDLMAGSGFSAKLIKKIFSPSKIWLNDFSPDSFDCLNHNFGDGVEVTQGDVNEIILHDKWDLIFVDFNTFTLKHIESWKGLFGELKGKFQDLFFVDTACYASLFGEERFKKAYGVELLMEYYVKLMRMLAPYGIHIQRVACAQSYRMAVVHAKPYAQKKLFVDHLLKDIEIQTSKVKGFPFG